MPSFDQESVKLLLDLLHGIVFPITQTQGAQTEALNAQNTNIQKLIELAQREPTRASILEVMRELIHEHDDNFESALRDHNKECIDRSCSRIVIDEAARVKLIDAAKIEFSALLKPATELHGQLTKILLVVSIFSGIAIPMMGWAIWLLNHLSHSPH